VHAQMRYLCHENPTVGLRTIQRENTVPVAFSLSTAECLDDRKTNFHNHVIAQKSTQFNTGLKNRFLNKGFTFFLFFRF